MSGTEAKGPQPSGGIGSIRDGVIQWFVSNPIAANLLMLLIIFGGLSTIISNNLNKEMFPAIPGNIVTITVPYPGAGPGEVEEQINLRIEEAIQDLDGIEQITSVAEEGLGRVTVEVLEGFETLDLYNDIKTRIDAIHTFPVEAERPQVTEEIFTRNNIMRVSVAGNVDESVLKHYGEKLRDELTQLDDVDLVKIFATRRAEVAIEVSEYDLRRYGLSFDDVAEAVRRSSVNLPAGTIQSQKGDIRLQTRGQAYTSDEFEHIPLISKQDGTQIRLGDVARVVDGFEDKDVYTRFNGKPAIFLDVFVSVDPDVLKTAAAVRQYIASIQPTLPPGLEVVSWWDRSRGFQARMDMMSGNAMGGLVLVFLVLMVFLRPMLALWVSAGIFIAYMGTLWVLPVTGISLNMVSLSAFLLILGIIVDDAIIIGESVHARQEAGYPGAVGATMGTRAVMKPVMFAVISTMIVFFPMFFLPGAWSTIMTCIPTIALLALTFSLIESFWILPSHLSSLGPPKPVRNPWLQRLEALRQRFAQGMVNVARERFRPFLAKTLAWNGLSIGGFILAFFFSIALVVTGYVDRSFMPNVGSDFLVARVNLPQGTATDQVRAVTEQIEQGIARLRQDPEYNEQESLVVHSLTWVEESSIRVVLELAPALTHRYGSDAIGERWKEYIGPIPIADSYEMQTSLQPQGKDIALRLTHSDLNQLRLAGDDLKQLLNRFPGVYNARDSISTARDDIDIRLKEHAEALGVGLSNVAMQVRQGFYGAEAQRIPRAREDVKVMIRYSGDERRSVDALSDMRVRTQDNREVPFDAVAETVYVPGYTSIKRIDGRRAQEITADVNPAKASATQVINEVLKQHAPDLRARYPGLDIEEAGSMHDESKFLQTLLKYLVMSILVMYALMAIEFRSYLKPIGVVSAVPFGIMGAIFGHLIMGQPFTVLSFFGILAVAGVVVNDNLVLIDRINQLRREGNTVKQALLQAGQDRFRPIMLTSLTTFIGLVPMMMETSMQARFLMPMIVALAYGVLFATAVTLVFVPAIYLAGARLRGSLRGFFGTDDDGADPVQQQ